MQVIKIIERYYERDSPAYFFLIHHSRRVMKKALDVAERMRELNPDVRFIEEASMLHDIGIFMTHSPRIGCHGSYPYVCHGYLGRELVEREGFPRHALVCERHVGIGLTLREIEVSNLPVPKRDMVPLTLEEQIICFADKFYSKEEKGLTSEKPVQKIRELLSRYSEDKVRQFDEWLRFFREPVVTPLLP